MPTLRKLLKNYLRVLIKDNIINNSKTLWSNSQRFVLNQAQGFDIKATFMNNSNKGLYYHKLNYSV